MSIHDDIMRLKSNNHNSVELDSEIDIASFNVGYRWACYDASEIAIDYDIIIKTLQNRITQLENLLNENDKLC